MFKFRIIPCLDVCEGLVVKGKKFTQLTNLGNPYDLAMRYYDEGADELMMLNIYASRLDCTDHAFLDLVTMVASKLTIPICVGGGISRMNDVRNLLNAGADKVSINSSLRAQTNMFSDLVDNYGSQCIVGSIDASWSVKQKCWNVFTHGGFTPGCCSVLTQCQTLAGLGVGEILLTSIDNDGMQNGFNLALLHLVTNNVTIPLIASGGGGTYIDCLEAAVLGGASGAVLASVLHQQRFSINQLKQHTNTFNNQACNKQ